MLEPPILLSRVGLAPMLLNQTAPAPLVPNLQANIVRS